MYFQVFLGCLFLFAGSWLLAVGFPTFFNPPSVRRSLLLVSMAVVVFWLGLTILRPYMSESSPRRFDELVIAAIVAPPVLLGCLLGVIMSMRNYQARRRNRS